MMNAIAYIALSVQGCYQSLGWNSSTRRSLSVVVVSSRLTSHATPHRREAPLLTEHQQSHYVFGRAVAVVALVRVRPPGLQRWSPYLSRKVDVPFLCAGLGLVGCSHC
jgi:hypothetical protein